MDRTLIEKKVDNLLNDLKNYVESNTLSENEASALKEELDKLLYECLYYKSKLIC